MQTAAGAGRPGGKPWEQLPGEGGTAYEAFAIYLRLGPSRDLQAAYRVHKGCSPGEKPRAPGRWQQWAKLHKWAERAKAYDRRDAGVADAARVQAITEQVAAQVVDEWAGRRAQQREQAWVLRSKLIAKAELMLGFGLARKVERDTNSGAVTVYEPVKWEMRDVVGLLRLAEQLGRAAAEMPLRVYEAPASDVGDQLFETTGQVAAALPPGAMPDMPEDPAAKPALGASVTQGAAVLTQPEKLRPV